MASIEYNPRWYTRGWAPWRQWLADAYVLWVFLGLVLAACLLADWIGWALCAPRLERLPYAGWLLEVAGVMSVALGVANKLDLFGGESMRSRIARWLRRMPILKQHYMLSVNPAHIKLGVGPIDLSLNYGPPPPDLKGRVSRLESMADQLFGQLENLQRTTREKIADVESQVRDEIKAVRGEVASVRELSSNAHVGGVAWELTGIGWVLAGLTFATIPDGVLWHFSWPIDALTIPVSNLCSLPAID